MRLFTGISLSAEVSHRLGGVITDLERSARVSWSPVENLHVTLKFIGSWQEERLAELEGALQSVRPGSAFPVRVAQLGYFPNPHRPHSLFAGVQAGPELAELAGGMDRAAAAIGIKAEEREYRPHITLARIKDHSQVRALRGRVAEMSDLVFGEFEVRGFHLYESRPGQRGSVYTKLATYDLEREKEVG